VFAASRFDVAIVDLGLTDPDGPEIARALCTKQDNLCLMVIPANDASPPPEITDLEVHGVLAQPFFFPELPDRVSEALSSLAGTGPTTTGSTVEHEATADSTPPISPPPPPTLSPVAQGPVAVPTKVSPEQIPDIVEEMNALTREINAEAAILTAGGELVAHTGRLSTEEVQGLAQAVADSWRTSVRVAEILGKEQLRFEQSTEGGGYLFYSLAIAQDVILSVALRAHVPLGMIRHRTKEAADTVRDLLGLGG
jgi:predicted regulator of Ras-like GTPase activity (Roadblock/LC7/MglB family)